MSGTVERVSDTDLSAWLVEHAITADDSMTMLDDYGRLLNAAGLPILRLNVALPVLDPTNRGLNLTWWRDRGWRCRSSRTTRFHLTQGQVPS